MIGIILGLVAGINFIIAAWTGNTAYFVGTVGTMVILTILGVILFPKTVARFLGVILAAAPIGIIIGAFKFLTAEGPSILWGSIILAVSASVALWIVKLLRPRARAV